MNKNKLKMLFIVSGPAAPGTTSQDNPFFYLSKYFEGHVVGTTWSNSKTDADTYVQSIQSSFEDFTYDPVVSTTKTGALKQIVNFYRYYRKADAILKSEKYDIICSYGFFVPGLVSSILSKKHNIPLLLEVPGVPDRAIEFSKLKLKVFAKLFQDVIIKICLKQATSLWLLFDTQLKNYKIPSHLRVHVGHEFSPIKMYEPRNIETPIISFLGHPWKLKGVDILIKAFILIQSKHPDAKLKIAGYNPDKTEFEILRKGFEDKIEFIDSMPREASIEFIKNTKVFVLPSRTEAMGRVLLEASSAKKGIVASNIDGIPYYISHNKNGLLFESENVEDLAKQLDTMLSNQELYNSLSRQAFEIVHQKYTEEQYAKNLYEMVKNTLESA